MLIIPNILKTVLDIKSRACILALIKSDIEIWLSLIIYLSVCKQSKMVWIEMVGEWKWTQCFG
jgi:hypothetical protein